MSPLVPKNCGRSKHAILIIFSFLYLIFNQLNETQRIFAQYYRVAYYGDAVEEIRGKEFVYKESGAIRVSEMSQRIQKQFISKLGEDKVHMLGNLQDPTKQVKEPEHLYIQLVSVNPYFVPSELKDRPSEFERHNDIKRFIYETPFSKTGKMTDDLSQQWKKKVIITTEFSFPHLEKRARVVKKEEVNTRSPPILSYLSSDRTHAN